MNIDLELNTIDENTIETLKECRICFTEETDDNPFISPCMCKGTSKYIHENCLNQWIECAENNYSKTHCMECHFEYRFEIENENLNYEKAYYFFNFRFHYIHHSAIIKLLLLIIIYFLIFMIDNSADNILSLQLINYNSNTPIIQKYIRTEPFMHYSYYKSISILTLDYIFLFYHIQYIRHKINNKQQYINEMFFPMFVYFAFITHTQVIYNLTNFHNNIKDISTYGNDTLDLLNFFIWDIFIRIHENVIFIINSKLGNNHIIELSDEDREQLYIDIRNQNVEQEVIDDSSEHDSSEHEEPD
tara:strand:+ start:3355 stop:4260 length:906 start_codon:yes stop_codon:yes gene_type:complete